jgi:hypothetical protein
MIASPADLTNIFMYADQFVVTGAHVDMRMADRVFTIEGCTDAGLLLLLTGVGRLHTSGLARRAHYLVTGDELTLTFTNEGSGKLSAVTAPHNWDSIVSIKPRVVHVSADDLWHVDVRWLLLRDLIAHYAETELVFVRARTEDEGEQVSVCRGKPGATWEWRRCRLRRYVLAGMSMSGYPDNVHTTSMGALAAYASSERDLTLTWNMGAHVIILTDGCLSHEHTQRLSQADVIALCVHFSVYVASVGAAYILAGRKQEGSLTVLDVVVCTSIATAAAEAVKYDTCTTQEWIFADNPGMLAAVAAGLPVTVMSLLPAAGGGGSTEDTLLAFFNSVCVPALAAAESGVTLDAEQVTLLLELVEDAGDDADALAVAVRASKPVRRSHVNK